ncbi:MAG TPA: HAD family phosphatase [Candidatus Binataceae bacterium]|nr:HAD family phosphatase [Candidatus Binataceae bacterium]
MIFDLDGTLADTEPLHLAAFNDVLRDRGIEIPRDEYFSRLVGLDDRDCFAAVLANRGQQAGAREIGDLIARKTAVYQRMIANRDVLYPGAERFLRRCAARFPLLLATGTLRAEAEIILGRAGIRPLFLDIVTAEDVARGKPDPAGFVATLGRIDSLLARRPAIQPAECLVVEDTGAGIEAAHRAGMKVLAVCHTAPAPALAAADAVCSTINDIDLDALVGRFAGGEGGRR